MRATVLVDNVSCPGIEGEWGLSIYIEYGDMTILLDTGGSDLFLENADKLGLDIGRVDIGVLSHAHYDHSIGMKPFFENNKTASFYMQEGTKENCYKRVKLRRRYIGLPRDILTEYSDRIRYVKGDMMLMPGAYIISHKMPDRQKIGKREKMFVRENGKWKYDSFDHEQSLVFDTDKGLVIFNSCSHAGAAAIITEVGEAFPDKKVYGIIGGFHLYNKTDEEVRTLAAKIRETGIEFACTGHCTGDRAYDILEKELGSIICRLHVNKTMEF
ncbi:MAG: MBL fold metallo-hydrolase [Bacillota bacterium]|nr:MBL fold metallo-hydrolase [Bacillota bacterium]